MDNAKLLNSFYNLMDRLDNINENNLSKYSQDAVASLIKDGEITYGNIHEYGINRKELKNMEKTGV